MKRVLPDWLSNPNVISADLKKNQLPVTDMPGLDKDLVERLLQNNVTHFFPGKRTLTVRTNPRALKDRYMYFVRLRAKFGSVLYFICKFFVFRLL